MLTNSNQSSKLLKQEIERLTNENKQLYKQLNQVGSDVCDILLKQIEELKSDNDSLKAVNESLMIQLSVLKVPTKKSAIETELVMLRKQVKDAEKVYKENEWLKMLLKENNINPNE